MERLEHKINYLDDISALLVEFQNPLRVVSSLPYQPRETRVFVFKRVRKGFRESLKEYYELLRRKLGLENAFIFLTAANVENYLHRAGDDYAVIATVGLEPPVCPGYSPTYTPLTGTVNILAATSHGLASSGLMDFYRVVVEAKTLAMVELMLRCRLRSPGTVTDAVAVAAPPGDSVNAGMATNLGSKIALEVYWGLVDWGVEALGVEGFLKNWLGYGVEELLEKAMQAYRKAPIPGIPEDRVRRELREILHKILLDPNVQAVLVMAREADLHASSGSLPGITRKDYEADTKAVIGDELLGSCLALYIAGFKALLAAYWVERLKEKRIISIDLPVFEDDVASALIGSMLTKLYDKHLHGL